MNKCPCGKTPESEPSGVGGRGGRAMPRLGWGEIRMRCSGRHRALGRGLTVEMRCWVSTCDYQSMSEACMEASQMLPVLAEASWPSCVHVVMLPEGVGVGMDKSAQI